MYSDANSFGQERRQGLLDIVSTCCPKGGISSDEINHWSKQKNPVKVYFFIPLCKALGFESSFAVRGAELNFYSSVWSPKSRKQGTRSLAHLIMSLSASLPRRNSCRYRLLRCKVWEELQTPTVSVITNRTSVNTHTNTRRVFTRTAIAASSLTLSSCTLHCHSGWHLQKKKNNQKNNTKLKQDCVHLQLGPQPGVPKHSRMLCQQPVSQLSTKHPQTQTTRPIMAKTQSGQPLKNDIWLKLRHLQ